jgi:glucose-6-phosphate 1-dehydrogenase
LFYLSVPPEATQSVVQMLGDSGLAEVANTKLLLEKPFGTDLASAEQLVEHLKQHFKEEQVYRIDHYLAKEMAQNLIVFRSANPVFSQTWNNTFISSIEIVASEKIGIEGRKTFYEQTGALRDVVQSHLLQLAALTLMELPKLNDMQSIPRLRCEALSAIQPAQPTTAIRGQYASYKEEVGNPSSSVETFVSLQLASTNDGRFEHIILVMSGNNCLSPSRNTYLMQKLIAGFTGNCLARAGPELDPVIDKRQTILIGDFLNELSILRGIRTNAVIKVGNC